MLEQYKDKKILIVGFEVEGRATFESLKSKGIVADVADVLAEDDFFKANPEIKNENVRFILGKNYLDSVSEYDVVFRTPGISPLTPELQLAVQKGIEVTSQIKLFMDLCPAKTIGVTGTKGKGTTSSLIYEILKEGGEDVYFGGNIGVPAISFLEKLSRDSIVVLELSSFQLMDLEKSPNIAVVLNITQDHLDYHRSRDEYVEAKKSIVKYQTEKDFAVINTDYETPKSFAELTKGEVWQVSTLHSVISASSSVISAKAGIQNVDIDSRLRGNDNYVHKNDNNICYINKNDEIVLRTSDLEEKIASGAELQLRGRHNLENICASVVASHLAGADSESIKKVVKEFKGLEHRLEFVAEIDGVKYYNDSFATTPETTVAAINAFHEPVILVAGGSKKGSDYTEMGKMIVEKVKTVFLIGDTVEEIKGKITAFNSSVDIQEGFTDMNDLVKRASNVATQGDAVVLSPGCASFGLFENYKQRGELYKKAVKALAKVRNLGEC